MASNTALYKEVEEESLLSDDELYNAPEQALSSRIWSSWKLLLAIVIPYIAFGILLTYVLALPSSLPSDTNYQTLYSPAQHVLKPESKVFELGFDDGFHDETTLYQGQPSDELDKRWEALYEVGMTKITRAEAAQLPNQTAMLPPQADDENDERGYVIMLDVFHQLHCLNMIRKALNPEPYQAMTPGDDGEDELLGMHHVDHCVDSLRQSLMCSVDVTPLVWQWSDERQKYLEKAQVTHTCRNFEGVKSWAAQRRLKERFSLFDRQMNDPLDASTWLS